MNLTDTISWGAVDGATSYVAGARDTTAPASAAGVYFWTAPTATPSVALSQFMRGSIIPEPLPTGVPIAIAVRAAVITTDANGVITDQTSSDWSAEIQITLDADAQLASSVGAGKASSGALASGIGQVAQPVPLAVPSGLAVS